MDNITTIKVTDYSRIKSAKSKFPDITVDNSDEYLKYLHSEMLRTKVELNKARELVRLWEDNYNKAKEEFNKLAELFHIEYETITKEHITHENNLGIIGMGNDIIGKQY